MDLPVNAFKHAIARGQRQIGLWSGLGSATGAEIIGGSGFDWIVIDTEHAPNDLASVIEQLRAMALGTAAPVVRPAWNDRVLMKRYLDAGAQTLLIPFVQTADEAAHAVASMRYPPRGQRGVGLSHRANRFGRVAGYFDRAESELCLLVQLETRAALGALEAIAATDGVDGVFIGPSDLAADFGHLGDNGHPEVQDAIAGALERCRSAGTPAGILTAVVADAERYLDMGFTFVAVGSDVSLLRAASERLREHFEGRRQGGGA
jgi:4-hydroxy-2-oxoheptanedioate aldolase